MVLEFGTSFALVKMKQTQGWLTSDLEVIDQFGPAAEPRDASNYTHRLDTELDDGAAIVNWLAGGDRLRNVTLGLALDYLVTGVPEEGGVVPRGETLFRRDGARWSLNLGLGFPLAPLVSR